MVFLAVLLSQQKSCIIIIEGEDMERLMTVDDVARYLRLNREVVLRKVRKGEIPAVKVGTRTYRFYGEQLDQWLKAKSTVKQEASIYSSGVKGRASRKDRSPVVKETAIGAEAKKAATSKKQQQLAVLAEARRLQARMEKRLGKPLPSSAGEIRALREERARRGS